MLNVKKIKADFPILRRRVNEKPLVYLDNAATSQRPLAVLAAMREFDLNHNANVHRGLHTLSEEASQLYESARQTVAEFIGARSDELVFTRNTTEAINLVAWTWGMAHIKAGDEILTTIMEHHSNFLPWQQLALAHHAKLQVVNITPDGRLDMKDFAKKLNRKTKLVAVNHMSNALGTINPVAAIVKLAKKVKAAVMVDAAQSVPHFPVDVSKLGVDFLAFSGHKMLSPLGIGGLYIKKERQTETGPFLTGGGMISEVYADQPAIWAKGVEKWEAGTPNISGAIGLAAAVKYLQKLGMANVRQHEQELTEYGLKQLSRVKGLRLLGPSDSRIRGGVLTFVFDKYHAHDVAQVLDSEGVAVRSGHHCTMPLHQCLGLVSTNRASVYIYNDTSDIDRLVEALDKVKQVLG
ncbi:MAG: SufS family cysteine desulfurase [Candidatus Beckwithbacteria bacterium]|nr:SufS family cysteine desulfurase [Candidatus Beckwithbacteria bacterium]